MKLEVGDRAPDFELEDDNGRRVRLSDFAGRPVVLAFYVLANTPGCAGELRAYQDDFSEFEKAGAQILGISVNKPAANRDFAQKLGLAFPLLCDPDKQVTRRYGVLSFFRVARRTTFVLDRQGVIRRIDRGRAALIPDSALETCRLALPKSD